MCVSWERFLSLGRNTRTLILKDCVSQVEEVTNVLQDGTLIDLCGATLLWRSAEGLEKSPVS